MAPSKTISIHIQNDATYPINYIRPITTKIRAMQTKSTGLAFGKCCFISFRLQVYKNTTKPIIKSSKEHTSQKYIA